MTTWTAKYSTCLDLATVLTIGGVVDAIAVGGSRRSPRRSGSSTTTAYLGSGNPVSAGP